MRPYKTVLKNRLKLAKGKVRQLHIVCRTRMSWTTALSYWVLKIFHGNCIILNTLRRNYIKHVCSNGGNILEIGFGAGITSEMIQKHNIKTHTIIERDDVFFKKLYEWGNNKDNVKTIHGDWVNSIPKDEKYDGIFLDLWDNIEDYSRRVELFRMVEKHTKPGTILVCTTENILDNELYTEKNYKCQEIKTEKPKLKWYNILSHIIKTNKPIFKIICK